MEDDQVWFFVRETLASQEYSQQHYTLKDIKARGLTLQDCLSMTNTSGPTQYYAFYIHSESMAAAVRMLNDQAIPTTHQLYCSKDARVTILIRGADEPSPNSSQAPSHQNSLADRRKVSRGKVVPEIFIRQPVRHTSGGIDLNTLDSIQDLPDDNKVTIQLDDGSFETYTKEYLLCE